MDHRPERPRLALIPGTLCDRRVFHRMVRSLRPALGLQLLEFRRGHSHARWLHEAMATLPERFLVAGFSLGGLFALEMLRRAPDRVAGVALIASNAEGGSARSRRRSMDMWRQHKKRGPAALARHLKPDYFHHAGQRKRHGRLISAMARATSQGALKAQLAWAAHRPPSLDLLRASPQRLLVVSGKSDRLCPPVLQKRILQAKPDAHWVELPRCGHFVPLERPSTLSSLLLKWAATNAYSLQGVAA